MLRETDAARLLAGRRRCLLRPLARGPVADAVVERAGEVGGRRRRGGFARLLGPGDRLAGVFGGEQGVDARPVFGGEVELGDRGPHALQELPRKVELALRDLGFLELLDDRVVGDEVGGEAERPEDEAAGALIGGGDRGEPFALPADEAADGERVFFGERVAEQGVGAAAGRVVGGDEVVGAVDVLLVAFWVGAALTIGWATGGGSCRHGESSVRAWRDARGRMRVSRPHLTGCLPP